jgi:hypothetical protein
MARYTAQLNRTGLKKLFGAPMLGGKTAGGPKLGDKKSSDISKSMRVGDLKQALKTSGVRKEKEKITTEGMGLHSSTSRLNISIFCEIRWLHDFPPVY